MLALILRDCSWWWCWWDRFSIEFVFGLRFVSDGLCSGREVEFEFMDVFRMFVLLLFGVYCKWWVSGMGLGILLYLFSPGPFVTSLGSSLFTYHWEIRHFLIIVLEKDWVYLLVKCTLFLGWNSSLIWFLCFDSRTELSVKYYLRCL